MIYISSMRETLKNIARLFKISFQKFDEENTFTLAAALAYYTIFSLPPILIIITNVAGAFLDESSVQEKLYEQVAGMVGSDGATQLLSTIENIGVFKKTTWTTVISVIVLLFTSTTVFSTIKNSLNHVFRVKSKPKITLLKAARDRLLSFAMILVIGFILLVSLLLDTFYQAFSEELVKIIPQAEFLLVESSTILFPIIIALVLFMLIFRMLPDAVIKWKDAAVGGLVTSLLFNLGKYLIGFYVSTSDIATVYDAAGSVLILMVWIFYSSVIFYYGAQITYVYANIFGGTIRPSKNAVRITFREAQADEFF